jgi:hypothetical protein
MKNMRSMSHKLPNLLVKCMRWAAAVSAVVPGLVLAQATADDVADQALASAFSRDNGIFLCLERGYTQKELRARFDPYARGIDTSNQESFRPLLAATYEAFPCPFAPARPELERAKVDEIVGRWIFPQSSIALRHGPRSPAWQRAAGVPPIKCEAVVIQASGAYKSAQLSGNVQCPDADPDVVSKMEALPQVAAWRLETQGRLRIDRSDAAGSFEEWDMFTVKQAFELGRFKFAPGDLLAYLRRDPKNEINAVTMFRHLKPLKPDSTSSAEQSSGTGVMRKFSAISAATTEP